MHAAAITGCAMILCIGHFAGIAETGWRPHITDGAVKGRIILARKPAIRIIGCDAARIKLQGCVYPATQLGLNSLAITVSNQYRGDGNRRIAAGHRE